MRHVLFVLLVVAVCLVQTSVCASYPYMPELPLALAAWAMIDGPEEGVLIRAWTVGCMYDLCDPGSQYFHTVAYVALAIALVPVRHLLFRRRFTAWAMWAAACSLVMACVDGWVGGWGDTHVGMVTVQTVLVASAAVGMGWMLAVIPVSWHPLGAGGA